ncbi:glycosyltransferase family 2 protein [Vibrio sp. JPW-9-11-11]|uniref:glycosyltransferase family 2 protein n=1 Tax=Vibrio sp. JPW-9-11-11 TaxID=1416532 RepID=UPI001594342C|nr:glycosyltransferase family 2 protein [Vibrio sp. JPW-9-11-11]NVD06722.1 glycosyltransferase family 2 protein [Vibrio sp. JPW-9-11-11]
MIDLILISTFSLCAFLIAYHHVGYPMLLSWVSKVQPSQPLEAVARGYKQARQDTHCLSITILVPAYNEQLWIADKIRNLACLDYPRDKYKVIVVCDGCSDKTVEIAEQTIQEAICSDTHFEIRAYDDNRGKVSILNQQIARIDTDIVALSDVSALISVDALWIANQHFQQPNIGVVNGHYQLFETNNHGENRYWQYQSRVKMNEAKLGSTLGAHGAFYLFRTDLFDMMDNNTINDDFVIPMQIVRRGYVATYEPRIMALEMEATNTANDYQRRLRISAGNMQQAILLFDMFLPKYRGVAFAFFSGKGLRLLTPYLLLACLISSALLASYLLFKVALVSQLTIYGLALLSHQFPTLFRHKVCTLVRYVVAGHWANLIGGLRYLFGLESGKWSRIDQ